MKTWLFLLLIILSGCLGEDPSVGEINDNRGGLTRNLTFIAITPEDLGFVGWVKSSENLSLDVFERRFVKVEGSFGAISRLVNRVHLYPDSETAQADFQMAAEHLETQISTTKPDLGDEAIMGSEDQQMYLLFRREDVIVELEYSGADTFEPGSFIDQGSQIDSKIKDQG
jgi:hypothetical protein